MLARPSQSVLLWRGVSTWESGALFFKDYQQILGVRQVYCTLRAIGNYTPTNISRRAKRVMTYDVTRLKIVLS